MLPCLGMRTGFSLEGTEKSYIGDYDVEIAQKSDVLNPNVFRGFTGIGFFANVEPIGMGLKLSLYLVDITLEKNRLLRRPSKKIGNIELPRFDYVKFDREMIIVPGREYLLGPGAKAEKDGEFLATRLKVKVETLKR